MIVSSSQETIGTGSGFSDSTTFSAVTDTSTAFITNFGRNRDPETGYKNCYRSDGSEPPPIPYELVSLAEAAVQDDAQGILNELPSMHPDVCLANFYLPNGLLDLHQERDESSAKDCLWFPSSLVSGRICVWPY
ncbi:hypothetical protein L1987_66830 [Smallanthus sonchifolius]|uniref:Uncharacterized protein n=1 Tax=Smallanthus sonchifolius TaxID=185202 RepID=A0ACB9BY80_9ASTR|nr:hypothetical protein L1987_66830 [Smallanthus sonchifolius]